MTPYVPLACELAFLADTLFQDVECDVSCVSNDSFGGQKQTVADRCVKKKLVFEEKCAFHSALHYRLTVRGREALKRGFERFLRLEVERMRP
jgi:hypothetical protein